MASCIRNGEWSEWNAPGRSRPYERMGRPHREPVGVNQRRDGHPTTTSDIRRRSGPPRIGRCVRIGVRDRVGERLWRVSRWTVRDDVRRSIERADPVVPDADGGGRDGGTGADECARAAAAWIGVARGARTAAETERELWCRWSVDDGPRYAWAAEWPGAAWDECGGGEA